MSTQPYLDALDIPSPSQVDHRLYIDSITTAIDWAHKHRSAPPHVADPEADFVIYISFLISETAWWISRFRDAQKKARSFYRDPITYWRTIAVGVTNRKVFAECKKLLHSLDPEKYLIKTSDPPALQQIAPERIAKPKPRTTHKRGELWKIDPRWEHLWPSSRKVFAEILRRTQYPKRPDYYPWCQAGVRSLVKYTRYSEHQVRRALNQLQRFGLIKRMFTGNTFQGASKYFVFLTPKMSGAFKHAAVTREKHPLQKKRTARIR